MKKIKSKDLHALILDAINSIDNSGFLETMKKLIKMYISSTAHSKIALKNTIQDQTWKFI